MWWVIRVGNLAHRYSLGSPDLEPGFCIVEEADSHPIPLMF